MVSFKKIVEVSANVAILVVCVLIGLLFWSRRNVLLHGSADGATNATLIGRTLAPPPGYLWNSHPETLILAIRKGCEYCEASLPFYHRLSEMQQGGKLHAYLLAVMPDEKTVGSKVLDSAGVHVDAVFHDPLNTIQVSGTPTLLLLNAQGRIEDAWVGQLPPQKEKEVVAALER